jgi:hypothetical protein
MHSFGTYDTDKIMSIQYRSNYLGLYSPLLGLGRLITFMILNTDSMTPWTKDKLVEKPLPTQKTTQTQNKRKVTSMSRVGFEPTTPVFE